MDQPGKVANPARGQLNKEYFFPRPYSRLRIWSRETGSAVPSRASLIIFHTQAESGAYSRDSSRFPRRRPFIMYLNRNNTPSGQSRVYRQLMASTSRARSLRNLLVSGNECGRVFPAGVGPGSPSRDAANWLPSRFSLSVETRRRYGWLRMMVFPGAHLFPSPNLVPFGRVAARERQGALSRRAW